MDKVSIIAIDESYSKWEYKGKQMNRTNARIYDSQGVICTLSARDYKDPNRIATRDRLIRKLTPREYFRLMDVSDTDIDKIQATGLSKTQQYKMAGNSIVVSCLYGIFKNLFVTEGERRDGQLMLPIRPTEEPV